MPTAYTFLAVSAIVRLVLPWKAPVKQITPFLFVNALAILIAFSSHSAPELAKYVFFTSPLHGIISLSFSARLTYPS